MSDNNEQKGRQLGIKAVDNTRHLVGSGRTAYIDGFESGYKCLESENTALKLEVEILKSLLRRMKKIYMDKDISGVIVFKEFMEIRELAEQALKENTFSDEKPAEVKKWIDDFNELP